MFYLGWKLFFNEYFHFKALLAFSFLYGDERERERWNNRCNDIFIDAWLFILMLDYISEVGEKML